MKDSKAYQLLIVLQDIKPLIGRRVLVPSSITFAKLHKVIQIAMGWKDCHLHQFTSDSAGPMKAKHEKFLRLSDVAKTKGPGSSFYYEYDTGDNWIHLVVLEQVIDSAPYPAFFDCLSGERACPPEDCGGPGGYADLLSILADPNHPEHKDRLDWVGGKFDPEKFDRAPISKKLKRLKL
ncbi:MAG: plasmid pRiA4b ORF-3 family protein [Elusimicrobiota bacterium]|nr:MAG: plasmid pRiA4b ORF-3 family protein [Elusimicrobiota bacterium]